MPQTNVLADWKATYPADAPRMKPGGYLRPLIRATSAGAYNAGTGVATLTVPSTTDYVGTVYTMTMSGFTPAAYNGTYQGTLASATTITYSPASNPGGPVTVQGTVAYTGMVPTGMGTTLPSTAVPNKPQWTGTQLMVGDKSESSVEEVQAEVGDDDDIHEEVEEDETEEDENGEPKPRRGRRRR